MFNNISIDRKVKFFNHETLQRVVLLYQQKKDRHKQEINQELCQQDKKDLGT